MRPSAYSRSRAFQCPSISPHSPGTSAGFLVSGPFAPYAEAAARFHQGSIFSQSMSITEVSRASIAR